MATLLIVDDSVTVRRALRKMIAENTDHEIVGEASNGIEALAKYHKLEPDLVTLDIAMPQMNGLDCLKRLIAKYPEAKVLMISSLSKKESVVLSLKYGAKSYILKPIEPKKLVETIDAILE